MEVINKMMDILEIMERIPHRYPFLLVDRIIEKVDGERIVAIKNVTMNEPFFQGHYPGKPVSKKSAVSEPEKKAESTSNIKSKKAKNILY